MLPWLLSGLRLYRLFPPMVQIGRILPAELEKSERIFDGERMTIQMELHNTTCCPLRRSCHRPHGLVITR